MKNLVHFYILCCLHSCLMFAATTFGFTLEKINNEKICKFYGFKSYDEPSRSYKIMWRFVWENNAKNISPTNKVSQLWTKECINADDKRTMTFTSVKEFKKEVLRVELKSNVPMTSQTYFCELTNLENLTLQIGLVDVADVGLNLTSSCVNNSKCGQRLKHLLLSNNKISILKNLAFCNLRNLVTLSLDNCELETIEEEAFANLKKLKSLSMHKNKISLLSPYQFRDNLRISQLILSYNNLSDHSIKSLQFLTPLRFLNLSHNKIENLDLQKGILEKLETVDLSYNLLKNYNNVFRFHYYFSNLLLEGNKLTNVNFQIYVKTSLVDLQNNQLLNIPKFNRKVKKSSRILQMSNNNITSIDSFQFINFTELENINLTSNKISTISLDAFTNKIEVQVLDLSRNQINMLNQSFVKSKIKKIILDFNYLKQFSYLDFSNFTEKISMKNNIISQIYNGYPTDYNWSLVEIDLSYNQIETIEIGLPYTVKKLNLSGNKIKQFLLNDFQRRFINYFYGIILNEISLADNQIELIAHYANYYKYSEKPSDYELSIKVHLEGNILKCSCENLWMLNYKNSFYTILKELDFIECDSQFPFESKQKPKHFLSLRNEDLLCESNYTNSNRCKMERLDREQFKCKFTCPTPCTCYTSFNFTIAHIYCSKANLTEFPTDFEQSQIQNSTNLMLYLDGNNFNIIKQSYFYNYSYLKQLHLNHSNIKVLEKSAFDLLPMLKILHLENNQISDLPANIFRNLHKLTELHLSNNLISHLETKLFLPLTSLNFLSLDNNLLFNFTVWELEPIKTLTLHSNPWSCDCDFALQFQQFLQNHTAVIQNIKNVSCIENGKNHISLLSFNSAHCFPTLVTNSLIHILISVGVIFISMTLIVVLIFIYRQEVQVFVYSHYKIRLFNKQNDVGKKFYDAFVIYSDLDVQFLVKKFIPKLEQIENPYKLCVHDRDFLPGAFIQDNIIQAVQESYRSIVLLNQNLLNSNWCLYEFKVAHAQMVNDGNHRVIIVVIGEIPAEIDEQMKIYLKTNTYLKWNEKMFWEKLYFVMSDKRVANSSSHFLESHFVDGHE